MWHFKPYFGTVHGQKFWKMVKNFKFKSEQFDDSYPNSETKSCILFTLFLDVWP